jgi:hypothetical protein
MQSLLYLRFAQIIRSSRYTALNIVLRAEGRVILLDAFAEMYDYDHRLVDCSKCPRKTIAAGVWNKKVGAYGCAGPYGDVCEECFEINAGRTA